MKEFISVRFKIWRQHDNQSTGKFEVYNLENISINISLLEALDQLNENLIQKDTRPINYENDCREGICGSCGFIVNGQPHGPKMGTTICQLYMRNFKNKCVEDLSLKQSLISYQKL